MTTDDVYAGERMSGSHFTAAVYGSILVTTVIASFALADQSADRAALFVAVAMLTYWLAHVWAGFVGARVHHQRSRRSRDRPPPGRKEWPIAEAAAVPLLILLGAPPRAVRGRVRARPRARGMRRAALLLGRGGRPRHRRQLALRAPQRRCRCRLRGRDRRAGATRALTFAGGRRSRALRPLPDGRVAPRQRADRRRELPLRPPRRRLRRAAHRRHRRAALRPPLRAHDPPGRRVARACASTRGRRRAGRTGRTASPSACRSTASTPSACVRERRRRARRTTAGRSVFRVPRPRRDRARRRARGDVVVRVRRGAGLRAAARRRHGHLHPRHRRRRRADGDHARHPRRGPPDQHRAPAAR